MALSDIDLPELGSIEIQLPNAPGGGITFKTFIEYDYAEDFLTPSDAGSFTLAQDQLSDAEIAALVPRAAVVVSISGQVQSRGIVSKIRTKAGRTGGTLTIVEFKDWMSPAVDSHVDPETRFTSSMTLLDLLTAVFTPFGMQVLATDNVANRNAQTGGTYGPKSSKKTGAPLKSFILHQEKPFDKEGAFAFAARVSQRFGLWLWPAVDGKTIIVGKPDFDQDPRYQLVHKRTSGSTKNNILESDVMNDGENQPSCIVARGFGGGAEFAKGTLWSGIVNPVVDADISAILDKYKQVHFQTVPLPAALTVPLKEPNTRPLFLKDADSHTQAQLDAFTLRELSLLMRKSLVANYTIEGHRLGGRPIAVDTMIDVDDDRSNLHQNMWVLGRRFSKTAHDKGTTTTLELIRPGSLVF